MKSTLSLKEFTKVVLFTMLMLVCANDIEAQQTTLTVDCQTPGWLSSKIGYKDQLSVKDLTVTGYLNLTDMSFLAGLTKNSLVHLDMSGVEMIEKPDGLKDYKGDKFASSLRYFSLPNNDNNLESYSSGKVDSVFVNTEGILDMEELGSTAKYLHIGDNLHSDYNVPKSLVMDAFHITKNIDALLESDYRMKLYFENDHSIGASAILGTLASFRYDSLGYWIKFGIKYAGPIICGYVSCRGKDRI